MKIRQGFVSNSSSSSFIVVGKLVPETKSKQFAKEDYKKNCFMVFYDDFCDGSCLFSVRSQEMWDKIIEAQDNPKHDCEFTFYKDANYMWDRDKITKDLINKEIYLFDSINEHSPEDVEDLKEAFGEYQDW